ncbi:hypothetical protein G6F57_017000 [Rhizopus arrhizus]|nr:hypothetical protein G6F57_017000 [Rhizopus arrhizus]
MAELAPAEHVGLVNVFSELERELDIMVVDTAAGITDGVLTFCQAAQDTVVVVCDEPASITDAYALIKVLSRERGVDRIQVVANMVRDPNEGRVLYEKLTRVCEKFLADGSLNYLGCGPQDDWLRLSVQRQQPVVKAYPSSPAALAITEIARRTARWQAPTEPRGGVEFFLERILKQPLGRQRGDRPALGPGAAHRPPPCRTPAGQRRSRRPDPGRHDGPDRGLAQLRRRPGRLVRDLRLDPHPRLDDR